MIDRPVRRVGQLDANIRGRGGQDEVHGAVAVGGGDAHQRAIHMRAQHLQLRARVQVGRARVRHAVVCKQEASERGRHMRARQLTKRSKRHRRAGVSGGARGRAAVGAELELQPLSLQHQCRRRRSRVQQQQQQGPRCAGHWGVVLEQQE